MKPFTVDKVKENHFIPEQLEQLGEVYAIFMEHPNKDQVECLMLDIMADYEILFPDSGETFELDLSSALLCEQCVQKIVEEYSKKYPDLGLFVGRSNFKDPAYYALQCLSCGVGLRYRSSNDIIPKVFWEIRTPIEFKMLKMWLDWYESFRIEVRSKLKVKFLRHYLENVLKGYLSVPEFLSETLNVNMLNNCSDIPESLLKILKMEGEE